jgi:hypothetical protein
MHIWTSLAAREAALLGILLLLGAAPASFLSRRFDAGSRIALAPLLGFCLGTCVTTTLLAFAPTNDTYWILVPLALCSTFVAFWRTSRAGTDADWRTRLPLRDIAALVTIVVVVTAPLSFTLHERHTVGPAVYTYTDVDNYVAVQDAARTVPLDTARQAWLRFERTGALPANLTQFIWSYFADFGSNLDATPLDSNVNALLSLGATDTYAPFLIELLLAGALGAFAAVRYLTQSRTWTAVLAGCLFAGPMFLELWFDSYQAAIVAIGLVVPFLLLVDDALRGRRRSDLVLIAMLLATLLSVYPLYMALVLAAGGLMLAWHWLQGRRSRDGEPFGVRSVALALVAIAVMTVAFDYVGFSRDVHYYGLVLQNKVGFPRVSYTLPLTVLPGWIGQTREFWNMPPLHSDFKEFFLGALLPLVFLGFIVMGIFRYRRAIALVALGAICAVVAEYAFVSQQSCTYCAERNLLPLAPITAILIALGLCALFALSTPMGRIAGAAGVLLVVIAVGQRARVELIRFANGSYFMDAADRSVLSRLPSARGTVLAEGFGASVNAQAEQPLVYHLLNERTRGAASVVLGSDLGNAIQYLDFGGTYPPGSEFNPNYRYVLTRFGGVATDRRVIDRSGAIALQERVRPLDVTPYSGLAVPLARVDQSGIPWVQTQYPLQLYIFGDNGGRPAWARLTFRTTRPATVPQQPGVTARANDDTLTVCARATGTDPVRHVSVRITASLVPATPPDESFPPAMPLEGVALTGMRAVTGQCAV